MPAGERTRAGRLPRRRVADESDRAALTAAFVRRYAHLLQRLGEAAPAQALLDALAAPDDVSGLAELLAGVAPLDPPPPDPLVAAHARGARAKEEILRKAGGGYRAGQVARLLDVTPQAIHARRQRGTLLAVPQPNGEFLYPACQFTEAGVVAGLDRFLKAFTAAEPWTQLAVLLSPGPGLEGRSPLEALHAADVEGAMSVARTYGEHLA
ncbi:MAG TPA: hypothetical protein VGR27_00370 [Longimicrobiaceae bacterium]|nr:hypothetical protein [Longimicrobiaceae bacterium]